MALKRGNQVTLKADVDLKEVSLRLKENESVKVILLGTEDYVQFTAHNDFANKIYPQPCLLIDDSNSECPYCVAYEAGMEGLKAKTRIKFAFYVVDQKKVMFWEATSAQAKKLVKEIQTYAEDIEFGSIFTFERTGSGKNTAYSLNLVSERKYTDADKQLLENLKEEVVTDEMFEAVCSPKSRKLAIQLLNETGFPVREHFSDADVILSDGENEEEATDKEDDVVDF